MEPIRRALDALEDRQPRPLVTPRRWREWFTRAAATPAAIGRRLVASPARLSRGDGVTAPGRRPLDGGFDRQVEALRRVVGGMTTLGQESRRWALRGIVVGGATVSLLVGLAVGGAFQGVDVALAPPGQATSPTIEYAAPPTAAPQKSSAQPATKPAAKPATTAPSTTAATKPPGTTSPSSTSPPTTSPPSTTAPTAPATTIPPTTVPPTTPTTKPNPLCKLNLCP